MSEEIEDRLAVTRDWTDRASSTGPGTSRIMILRNQIAIMEALAKLLPDESK